MCLKISVILPSFLGTYENCAQNLKEKFKRAVNSFLSQDYEDRELIIISDGCDKTIELCSDYMLHPQIKVIKIPKQELFSGVVRNVGIFYATGDFIAYLDADDYLADGHLSAIVNGFNHHTNADWVYFDDCLVYSHHPSKKYIFSKAKRDARIEQGSIGTSNIAHRKLYEFSWNDCHNYNHDWLFIQKLIEKEPNPPKIDGAGYYVCHIPNSFDS
ncbi:MAG TPA: glycosyltransferase family A protein [Bacteroidia bacterium]|jgi:glycosyltransferase involved in cell wall biosynthesis|nr:glycosyltransferase family A protein [Bacteroidia bacterium]